jgi:hypothetical protein
MFLVLHKRKKSRAAFLHTKLTSIKNPSKYGEQRGKRYSYSQALRVILLQDALNRHQNHTRLQRVGQEFETLRAHP